MMVKKSAAVTLCGLLLGLWLTAVAVSADPRGARNDEDPMQRIRDQIHEQYWQRKEQRRRLERQCQQERSELRAGRREGLSPACVSSEATSENGAARGR
ncbi:hypothetical protein [Marinobacter sp. SS21]|uniref:hypothetical protein n=1 Tax=Marinobacter sp. SS21 TaxID=2979460 RepID=UPI002330050D|nr:hypothetical protein [Marinobacter sp. SS21]MDC0662535.1 hypothetical protein [Marinobacter sp. SS21]